MAPSLNLRHLLAALEVRKRGSISAATRQMYLSQSAITQALSKLEREIGQTLFTRTPKGLVTTEVGEIFLLRVERAIQWLTYLDSVFSTKEPSTRRLYRLLTATQLRALVTVVQYRNYSLAAKHLKLTQPTLHRSVKDMEGLCGLSFFQRSPSGVEPNWHARQAARYGSLYFSELSQGLDEISEHIGHSRGRLRVGSLPLARTSLVPRAVTKLLHQFPSAQISIIDGPYEEQLDTLRHGQLDLIVGALRHPTPSNDIQQNVLFSDGLHLVFRPKHPIADKPDFSVLTLQELDWVAPPEDAPARAVFTKFFKDRGLEPPQHLIECSSLVATRALLLESDRAALLSKRQVEVEVDRGLLAISPKQLSGTNRDIGFTTRANWKPTKLQARFLELLSELTS